MFCTIVFFGAIFSIRMNGIYLRRFRVCCIDLNVREESSHTFFCRAKVQLLAAFIGSLQSGIIYSTPSNALCGFMSVYSRAPAS